MVLSEHSCWHIDCLLFVNKVLLILSLQIDIIFVLSSLGVLTCGFFMFGGHDNFTLKKKGFA